MSTQLYNTTYEASDYPTKVAFLLQGFLFRRRDDKYFDRLAALLNEPAPFGEIFSASREQAQYAAWVTLAHHHERTRLMATRVDTKIMTGLLQNNRWRECTKTEQGFLALALSAAACVRVSKIDSARQITRGPRPRVFEALLQTFFNEWLAPLGQVDYDEHALAAAMFGKVWYEREFANRHAYRPLAMLMVELEPALVMESFAEHLVPAVEKIPDLSE
jgi:hypothetical protein